MIKCLNRDFSGYLGRNLKDLFISERRLIIKEAYRIINDYRIMQKGEVCEVTYSDFIKSYNKVCRDFFGPYRTREQMRAMKQKPPRINIVENL